VHGFELCRIIKRHEDFRRTPIILLSASAMYNDPRDRAEGLLAGATMFLPKPITMDKLWAEISDLIK
jgi:CheY-like chemotaxis protein